MQNTLSGDDSQPIKLKYIGIEGVSMEPKQGKLKELKYELFGKGEDGATSNMITKTVF